MGEKLNGKSAIVTGADSDVGRAVAARLAEAGAKVMLTAPGDCKLSDLAKELEAAQGSDGNGAQRIAHFCCNLDEKLSVNNLLAATKEAYGRIDILVNAARRSQSGGFLDMKVAEFDEAVDINVRSVFVLAQAVARKMIQQSETDPDFSGAIVNVTSIASRRTVPELFGYSVACAALDQLTRSMASSLAEHRIRVNAVALGSVMTSTLREALKERSELREEMVRVTPLGRIGEAEEAANAVCYLASPEASFVTGQILAVDGGRTVLDPLASPVR
ncbi:MAG: SDR family oxidoreductase [Pseudomonadota bacterium]